MELGFPLVAFTTKWHVHVCTSDQGCAILRGSSKSKAGVLLAKLANSRQLLYLLALWDQSYYVCKSASQESTLQGGNDHYLLFVGGHL